jgi:hypothetical protein
LVGVFPKVDLAKFAGAPQAIHTFQFDARPPYAMQWSLSAQNTLSRNLVAEVAYTGARGVHLANNIDLSVPVPQVVNGETFFPATETRLLNPAFSRHIRYGTGASSAYHALRTTVSRRTGELQFQASYTWSKALDTQSSNLQGELSDFSVMDAFDQKRDWGPSGFHIAHAFTGNAIWELTTGSPFGVSSNGRITHPLLGAGSRPDLIPGGNNNPVLGGPDRYFDPTQFIPQRPGFYGTLGRNTLVGPGLVNFDASVAKTFPVHDTKRIQFRAEFFNLANRTNFGLPSSSLFDSAGRRVATAGRITRTVTSARQVQLAIRFDF